MPLIPRVERTLALYALILALAGGLFVLLFWIMGAINLSVGQGLITQMQLGGLGTFLYYAYPFVLVAAALVAGLLFVAKQEALAIAVAGLPVAGFVVVYLLSTLVRF